MGRNAQAVESLGRAAYVVVEVQLELPPGDEIRNRHLRKIEKT